MFILRNVGNFVPPFKPDNDFHGSAAAIEYAVSILNVKDIIVCGHSHCGACKALYQEIDDDIALGHIKKWLEIGKDAKLDLTKISKIDTKEEIYKETEKRSIKVQLKNLFGYPAISAKYLAGELNIHGWYYKIETGTIEIYNESEDRFEEMR
jgi:carbonic anhydrase